jgi:hypothetical protein
MVFAKIRAQVVFPTPRGPQNKNACAKWPVFMAFFKVLVICAWPTTVLNVAGRYLRADQVRSLICAGSLFRILFGQDMTMPVCVPPK